MHACRPERWRANHLPRSPCRGLPHVNDMDESNARRPDAPDLPETETDDEAPHTAPKRLVMSRELRGWMAVFAAITVAAAAVAPTIDYADLTGAALPAVSAPVGSASELACTAEDQTGGVGGQSIACTFTCPDAPGTISVFVDADDSDAHVSGTADCGDSAHCSGKNSCTGTESRTSSGPGTCSADSDETVDSGLYVSCSAEVSETIDDDLGDVRSDWCPVTDPTKVCVQPVCAMFLAVKADTCNKVWNLMVGALTPTSQHTAFFTGVDGAGLSCAGYVCQPFEPVCIKADSRQTCFAP